VKSAFRASEPDEYHPSIVTERVRAGVAPFGFERFVTLIALRISPSEGRLLYVNAGHPPGFVWNARGRRERLPGTGPLLSPAISEARWQCDSLPVSSGDHLLLYTDGISDALYQDDDGEPRIRAAIEQYAGSALLDALFNEIDRRSNGRPPQDDLTLVTASLL
jgi:sigma-B regulation protein RsbU (phosphoserine phosphatase)